MPGTLYALLVGINSYQSPVPPLKGCLNDIREIETLLRNRLANTDFNGPELHVLLEEEATREKIIRGFREHLCQAKEGDVALFYYSGHGSQERTQDIFRQIEPDGLNETLVGYDSRQEGKFDLADKELTVLLDEVGRNKPHIVVILDCCHSGSGVRGEVRENVRRAPIDIRERDLSTMLFSASSREASAKGSDWLPPLQENMVVLSACRAEEEAKEILADGQYRGAFSHFLTDTLQRAGRALTYRDLFKRAEAMVRNQVTRQEPQFEARTPDVLEQPFLGGAVADNPDYFTLTFNKTNHTGSIDGGTVHGIPNPRGTDKTTLAIFSIDSEADAMRDLSQSLGTATVTRVDPGKSAVTVAWNDGVTPETGTYRAVITGMPLDQMRVRLEGNAAGLALLRDNMNDSLFLKEADADETADYRLHALDTTYRLTRADSDAPLTDDIEISSETGAWQAVRRLESIARWTLLKNLENPDSRLAGMVQMEIHQVLGPSDYRDGSFKTKALPDTAEHRFEYIQPSPDSQELPDYPQYQIKLINRSKRTLYAMLVGLASDFSVRSWLIGGCARLAPYNADTPDDERNIIWSRTPDGDTIFGSVPDTLLAQGHTEDTDIYKLIVSTEPCDVSLLEQDGLRPPTFESRGVSDEETFASNTLNRLLGQTQKRVATPVPPNTNYADWTTDTVTITIARLEATAAISTAESVSLGSGVTIAPHPTLTANARLTSVSHAARDITYAPMPALLADDGATIETLTFTSTRSGEPGLSVLELTDISDYTAVTPESPLIVTLPPQAARSAEEAVETHILPVGFDGTFYLPLGRAVQAADGSTQVELRRLPEPVVGSRSLIGSVRIFFKKIVSRITRSEFEYPLLAVAEVSDTGKVTQVAHPEVVRERVRHARRIVLYVHGIFGDTVGMAASARNIGLPAESLVYALQDRYDLVLTFDYENIGTQIDKTARELKERLAAVGLGPEHGKTLHIVAHSMGGLVSRWFIEKEGGDKVVQHLAMLGTPNAGSPWLKLEDWATFALTIGLNRLGDAAWPAKIFGGLTAAIEKVDVTMDAMVPGSEFLQALNQSDDPGVPYTVIAGQTSLIPVTFVEDGDEGNLLSRLWQRLFPTKNPLHNVASLTFFGAPNDLAVAVKSIESIPPGRIPAPQFRAVACDHLTYFSTEAGLKTLSEFLPP